MRRINLSKSIYKALVKSAWETRSSIHRIMMEVIEHLGEWSEKYWSDPEEYMGDYAEEIHDAFAILNIYAMGITMDDRPRRRTIRRYYEKIRNFLMGDIGYPGADQLMKYTAYDILDEFIHLQNICYGTQSNPDRVDTMFAFLSREIENQQ